MTKLKWTTRKCSTLHTTTTTTICYPCGRLTSPLQRLRRQVALEIRIATMATRQTNLALLLSHKSHKFFRRAYYIIMTPWIYVFTCLLEFRKREAIKIVRFEYFKPCFWMISFFYIFFYVQIKAYYVLLGFLKLFPFVYYINLNTNFSLFCINNLEIGWFIPRSRSFKL